MGAKGGKIKDIVDVYVLAPEHNIEQEEGAHLILAHVITRHMREVARTQISDASISAMRVQNSSIPV